MQAVNYQEVCQKILFINDVEKMVGRNRLTLRRWWLAGKFPKPVKLNGTDLAWEATAIENWIKTNLNPTEV